MIHFPTENIQIQIQHRYLIVWGNNQHHQLGATIDTQKQISKEKSAFKNPKPIKVPTYIHTYMYVYINIYMYICKLLGPNFLDLDFECPSITSVACRQDHTVAVAQGRSMSAVLTKPLCQQH